MLIFVINNDFETQRSSEDLKIYPRRLSKTANKGRILLHGRLFFIPRDNERADDRGLQKVRSYGRGSKYREKGVDKRDCKWD